MIKVVDISHHQGVIDWDKLKSQGVDAVLMKCTQGTSFKDPRYLENKKQARAHGFLCGFYHFAGNLQADGKTIILANPEDELKHFLKNVGDILPGEWVILDFEPKPLPTISVSWCVTFIRGLKTVVGYNPIHYTYENVLQSFDWSPLYKMDIGLWVAKYGNNDGTVPAEKPKTAPWPFYVLWQYTSRALGQPYGVSSKFIDLNNGEITKEVFKKYGKPSGSPVPPEKVQFHRYGHMDKVFVKLGDKVKKGQEIGTIGDGNGQYPKAAHVHYDCPCYQMENYWDFPIGLPREWVRDHYTTPYLFIDRPNALPTYFDHLGYDYLQKAVYPNGTCWHPGCDINGKGGGNSDFGQIIKATRSGEVVYCYADGGKNHGWGKLLVIKEGDVEDVTPPENPNETLMYQNFFKKICKVLGFDDFGDNMNENEAKRIVDKVEELVAESKKKDGEIVDLKVKLANLESQPAVAMETPVVTPAPVAPPADAAPTTPVAPEVIAVIPPAETKPIITLGELLKKLFRFNK